MVRGQLGQDSAGEPSETVNDDDQDGPQVVEDQVAESGIDTEDDDEPPEPDPEPLLRVFHQLLLQVQL